MRYETRRLARESALVEDCVRWIESLRLQTKVLAALVGVLLVMGLIDGWSAWQVKSQNDAYRTILRDPDTKLSARSEATADRAAQEMDTLVWLVAILPSLISIGRMCARLSAAAVLSTGNGCDSPSVRTTAMRVWASSAKKRAVARSPIAASEVPLPPMFRVATVPRENCRIGLCGHAFGKVKPLILGSKFVTRTLGTRGLLWSMRP